MEETRMQPCSKCLQPAGNDAVLLKNGCYMCPSCYQRAYPAKPMSSGPNRIVVSVEGVLTILLLMGAMYGAYALYTHHIKTTEAEAAAQKQAEEIAEKRQREERASSEAERKKYEEQRMAADAKRDADRKAQQEAAKVATELRKKELELKQQQIEKQRLDEQAKRDAEPAKREAELRADAAAKERQETLDLKKDVAADVKRRQYEIAELRKSYDEQLKTYQPMVDELTKKKHDYTTYKTICDAKKESIDMLRKTAKGMSPYTGVITQTETGSVYQPTDTKSVVDQHNKIVEEMNKNIEIMNRLGREIKELEKNMEPLKKNLDIAKKNIGELTAQLAPARTDATTGMSPLGVALPDSLRGKIPGGKTLYKKDGTAIQIQSYMAMDKEIKYTDRKGEWHMIATDEVDHIEKNTGVADVFPDTSGEMVPGSTKSKSSVKF